ncbi:non-specific serine/threonine protein kinase [Ranunculus cassubicifolius]
MGSVHSFYYYLFLLVIYLIFLKASAVCDRTCGNVKLPYPFGVSSDCEIKLNCRGETGKVMIGDFEFLNFTSNNNNMIVEIPKNCSRSSKALNQLFTRHFAITNRSTLLFGDCNSNMSNTCTIPATSRKGCSRELKCYTGDEDMQETGFLNSTRKNQVVESCKFLFSSILDDSKNRSEVVSFEFQRIELGWWLEHDKQRNSCSNCSRNAVCVNNITSPFNGKPGFRCSCDDGYVGDGFLAGDGCRKVSSKKCNPSNYMSGQCGGTTRVGVLVGGIIAGACLMSGLALLCHVIRRRSSASKSNQSAKNLLADATGSSNVPFYSYREIERATSYFAGTQRIGTGAYGTVYVGKLNDEWVAIKKIRHREADGIEQIMNEISLLSSVSHPNLVRLLGCCIERGEQILVYEYMPNGTLSQHLQKERGSGLPWAVRLDIATETAQAIAHLHSSDNPIYHRDIKSSNILLDDKFKSKVADFGLSRLGLTEDSHISTAPQGTPGYLDPQYHQNFHLSDKSDVYSFGVVLVEIITALKVVDFSRPNSEINLASLAVEKIGKGSVDEIMDPSLEPHTDAWTLSSVHKVAELAFRCLAFHRDMRPSMLEVAAELECIRLGSWGPSEENECLGSSFASEKSQSLSVKKMGIDSRRLVLPLRSTIMVPLDEVEDSSPISVQDPWFSQQSSPSADSLLNNTIN